MSQVLRVAMAQLNLRVGDIHGNVERIIEAAGRARAQWQADVIVFPELSLCGYPPEDLLLRGSMQLRIEAALERLCREVRGIRLLIGFPWVDGERRYNACALLDDGVMVARYYKQKLPNYQVFDEKRYFDAGEQSCVVDIAGVPVALSICEDIWHAAPMAGARAAGARLMLNLNASPFHLGKQALREETLAQRAREGGMPIVYVNQVGGQDELVFDGGSCVVAASGHVLQRAPAYEEGLFLAELQVDDELVRPQPAACVPLAGEEASVYGALVLGVRDYVRKNGFKGVVLGLSGGVDSALTLAVAVDALGADAVHAVMMPSQYTANISVDDSREMVKTLGVQYSEIAIKPMFDQFLAALAPQFAGLPEDTTEENLQARIRGTLLMALSNKTGKLVLTTGNKSEMTTGYATLYGDMAGGFAVLKDVKKTLVYALSNYRNSLGPCIPQRIIDRPPSAELRPDQCDQDSLPPYDVLDGIMEAYVEGNRSPADIMRMGYAEADVRRVVKLIKINEYKRRQAPVGIRITARGYGKDWQIGRAHV